jgi:hypothetical protein
MKKMICIMQALTAAAVCGGVSAMNAEQGARAFTTGKAQGMAAEYSSCAKGEINRIVQRVYTRDLLILAAMMGSEPAETYGTAIKQGMMQMLVASDPKERCDEATRAAQARIGTAAIPGRRVAELDELWTALKAVETGTDRSVRQWQLPTTLIVAMGSNLVRVLADTETSITGEIRRWWQVAAEANHTLREPIVQHPGPGAVLTVEIAQWLAIKYKAYAEERANQAVQWVSGVNAFTLTTIVVERRAACILAPITQGIAQMLSNENPEVKFSEQMEQAMQQIEGATTAWRRAIALDNLWVALADTADAVAGRIQQWVLTTRRALLIDGMFGELVDADFRLRTLYEEAAVWGNQELIAGIQESGQQRLTRAIQLLTLGHRLPDDSLERIRVEQAVARSGIEWYTRGVRASRMQLGAAWD